MPRSSKKTKDTSSDHDDKKITIRTDLDPSKILDPSDEAFIIAELAKINELKKTGVPKPKEISWGDWMGPKTLKPKHYVFANLIAMGLTGAEICKETGLTPANVSNLMHNQLIRAYVNKLQSFYANDAKARFDKLITSSVRVYEEVLDPYSNEPTKLKVDVANKVIDRSWGKSAAEMQDTGNTVLKLLRELKNLNDSSHHDPVPQALEVHSAERAPEAKEEAELFTADISDDGSVSDLLENWKESNNESSGEEEDEVESK